MINKAKPGKPQAASAPKAPAGMHSRQAPEMSQKAREAKAQITHHLASLAERGNANNAAMTAALAEASMSELDSALLPSQSNSFLRFAVIISVVFHLGLLTIKFTDPQAIRDFLDRSTLEVVLINAQSEQAPTKAQVLAQNNHAGGGESNADEYATTPQERSDRASTGDSFEEMQASLSAAREESMRLLNQAKSQYAQLPPIDPTWGENDPRRLAEEERRKEFSDRVAAIEQRINEENSRPRRMYIGPAAKSDIQALYYDMIRRKIEQKGTESFPVYDGKPLYGTLLMAVTVNAKGVLVSHDIKKTSGNAVLDRQAQSIVTSAGPFPAAPPELLRIDSNMEFVFIMRFNFLNEGRITTELMPQ